MTAPNKTHAVFVVDRSGSMTSIQADAEGGINTLLKDQAKLDGEMTYSIYQFDDTVDVIADFTDVREFEGYTLTPRGGTALNDTIMFAINQTGSALRKMPEAQRPEFVKVFIITDGGENSSKEYPRELGKKAIKKAQKHQEDKYGWEFTYVNANLDAFAEGSSYGFANAVQYVATPASTAAMYTGLSTALLNSRSAGVSIASTLSNNYASDGTATTITPTISSQDEEE